MSEQEKAKWEARANRVDYNLHKGYTIHNSWARLHNRHEELVYNVDGKELTLRQIWEREHLTDPQLILLEVSECLKKK